MYIAGSNDDIQGGICYGGIAHAGPVRYQRAMWFDGINDYINLGAIPISGLSALNFYCNMSVGSATDTQYLLYRIGAGSLLFQLYQSSNFLVFNLSEGATQKYGYCARITSKNLHDLFVIFDGTGATNPDKVKIYIDGIQQSLSFAGTMPSALPDYGASNMWIGTTSTGHEGVLRNILFFDRVLSDGERTDITQGTIPASGNILRYKGDGINNSNWINLGSVVGNNGTVNGSPDPAYIRGDGKIIVNGTIMNP